jgi:hypothetical protein
MKKTTKYILIIAVIAVAVGIFFTSRVIVATAFFKNESKIFYLENECDVSTLADLLYQDSIISSTSPRAQSFVCGKFDAKDEIALLKKSIASIRAAAIETPSSTILFSTAFSHLSSRCFCKISNLSRSNFW